MSVVPCCQWPTEAGSLARVLTGSLLALGAWALAFRSPPALLVAVLVAVGLGALREFYALARAGGITVMAPAGYAVVIVWLLVPSVDRGLLATLLLLGLLAAGTLAELPKERLLATVAVTLGGAIYVAGPVHAAIQLHTASPHWLVYVLALVGVGDSVALGIGRWLGRHPLSVSLSPRKTWEGTVSSAIASTVAGASYLVVFLGQEAGFAAIALSLCVNVASQIGDLVESALKRAADVKDSGNILPGHGGLLDRVDGLIFALPVVHVYLLLLG